MQLTLQVKMLLPRRKLKPRTFRAGVGQTVFVGGVLRIDVQDSPGATLYLTVWASDKLICHFGKTASADDRCPPLKLPFSTVCQVYALYTRCTDLLEPQCFYILHHIY